jgi:hypothetical protein
MFITVSYVLWTGMNHITLDDSPVLSTLSNIRGIKLEKATFDFKRQMI